MLSARLARVDATTSRLQRATGMTPIYLPDNCSAAYQLNWSVAVFGRIDFPPVDGWIEPLQRATEADGVRILEYQVTSPNVAQFLVSTRPDVSPSEIVRSMKGRWQFPGKCGSLAFEQPGLCAGNDSGVSIQRLCRHVWTI